MIMRKKIVRSRAPLRLGFAGGGTDVPPYCDIYGGAVLNSTIDRYAYATISYNDSDVIEFHAQDKNIIDSCSISTFNKHNHSLVLHREIYNYVVKKFNNSELCAIKLSTFCDAPPGSGLGSSSTLVVAILKAFLRFFDVELSDYDLAKTAYEIERVKCKLNGGRQDQFAATFGGMNFMEFNKNFECLVTPLRINEEIFSELEASIILYFTGTSRDSEKIINDQSLNVKNKNEISIDSMHAIKNEAYDMKNAILMNDFSAFVESIKLGWENKKKSSKAVSNKLIDKVYDHAVENKALAGKVSGAGGGGFMWFYVSPLNRIQLMNSLTSLGGIVSNCHFVQRGAQSWILK